MEEYRENCEKLCNAIVKRAADDYRKALITLKRRPKNITALRMKEECERFFENDIGCYSDLDGEMLMQGIQSRVEWEQ